MSYGTWATASVDSVKKTTERNNKHALRLSVKFLTIMTDLAISIAEKGMNWRKKSTQSIRNFFWGGLAG